jgi:hypothetical protein
VRSRTAGALVGAALALVATTAPLRAVAATADSPVGPRRVNLLLSCQGPAPFHGMADFTIGAQAVSLDCDEGGRIVDATLARDDASERWRVVLALSTPDEGLTCADGGARLPALVRCTLGEETLSFGAALAPIPD